MLCGTIPYFIALLLKLFPSALTVIPTMAKRSIVFSDSWVLSVDLHWKEIPEKLGKTIQFNCNDDIPVGDCPGYLASLTRNLWEEPITTNRMFFKAHDPASGPWPVRDAVMQRYLNVLVQAVRFERVTGKHSASISYVSAPAACIAELEALPRFTLPYFAIDRGDMSSDRDSLGESEPGESEPGRSEPGESKPGESDFEPIENDVLI